MTGHKEKYRMAISLLYYFERDETMALSHLQKKIDTYNFFTKSFQYTGNNFISQKYPAQSHNIHNNMRLRHLALSKIVSFDKIEKLAKKIITLEKLLVTKNNCLLVMLPCILSSEKVFCLHNFNSPYRIPFSEKENLFAQIELAWENNHYQALTTTTDIFSIKQTITFFTDLRRLLQQE